MATRFLRGRGMEAAAEPRARPAEEDELRRLRRLLEARQRHLRARIAACEALTAEMAALRDALAADSRPPAGDSGSARRMVVGPAPAPPAGPGSPPRQVPGPAGGSPVPGGGDDAKP